MQVFRNHEKVPFVPYLIMFKSLINLIKPCEMLQIGLKNYHVGAFIVTTWRKWALSAEANDA